MVRHIKTVLADKQVVFEDKVATLFDKGFKIKECGVVPDWDQTSMSLMWWAILEKEIKGINDNNWS